MPDAGWIKLHRKALKSSVWGNPNIWRVFTWCLLKASHKEYNARVGYQEIPLHEGQLIFTRRVCAQETGLSERVIRSAINALKSDQMLDQQTTSKFSVLTVCNWRTYQIEDCEEGQQSVRQATSKRPSSDQQATHIQEGKECKEETTTTLAESKKQPCPPELSGLDLYENDQRFCRDFSKLMKSWQSAFDRLDIMAEIRKAHAWELANPAKRKKQRARFIQSWLQRANDKAKPAKFDDPEYVATPEQYEFMLEIERKAREQEAQENA